MPAMLGCNTVCPNCKHQFTCCPPAPTCCNVRRSLHVLSGGGLVTTLAPPPPPSTLTQSSPCPSPQISPSAQLAFVIPSPFVTTPLHHHHSNNIQLEDKPGTELERLSDTVRVLRQSGWYYEGISYERSNELLKNSKVGTFLVRNSSDPRFFFSLSVQTDRGPTSVRLYYSNGNFRLDAQPHLELVMPLFPSVMELVQHYVKNSKLCNNNAHVWVDPQGKLYSPIVLDKPLRKEGECPSLKHLSRLAVHKAIQASTRPRLTILSPSYTQLELPISLSTYLAEYPYSI